MSRAKNSGAARAGEMQDRLLCWFDCNKRAMPWRARAGHAPNPYHVWLSEIMLQQTTVAAVAPYFEKFVKKWPTVKKLAAADLDAVLAQWAGLGYYARARNLHACAQTIVRDYGGAFPCTVDELRALQGIGPYTAAAIASIAFDVQAVAVDGNVERVVSRLYAIETPLPRSKPDIKIRAEEIASDVTRAGDFTQAFMELGATVCTPKNPKCGLCPWQAYCKAGQAGTAARFPRKTPKAARPVRYGKVFWITDAQGRFLVHKRSGKGLYEGLYQLPTTQWTHDKDAAMRVKAPFSGLVSKGLSVRHTFTHFDVVLEIYTGVKKAHRVPVSLTGARWIYPENMGDYGLPSLMKKAIKLCMGARRLEQAAG